MAVLENQNKALIEELKKLKELYSGNGAKSVRFIRFDFDTGGCARAFASHETQMSASSARFATLFPDTIKTQEERLS